MTDVATQKQLFDLFFFLGDSLECWGRGYILGVKPSSSLTNELVFPVLISLSGMESWIKRAGLRD